MSRNGTQGIVDTLAGHLPELRARYKVKSLALFGSSARGEQGPGSDIDILVEFEHGADLLDLAGVGAFLEERLGRRVDVVSKGGLRDEIRDEVTRETIPI